MTSLGSWLRGVRSAAAQVAGRVGTGRGPCSCLCILGEEGQLLVSGKEDEQSLGNCQREPSWGLIHHSFGASPQTMSGRQEGEENVLQIRSSLGEKGDSASIRSFDA